MRELGPGPNQFGRPGAHTHISLMLFDHLAYLTPKRLTLFECYGPIAGKTPSRPSTAAYEGARHTHIPARDPSTTLSVIICA